MAKKNARNTRGKSWRPPGSSSTSRAMRTPPWRRSSSPPTPPRAPSTTISTEKDALLSTLSDLFDQKYLALQEAMDPAMPAMDKLLFLNRALFRMIENSVSMDLLARLLSTQLGNQRGKAPAGPQAHLLPPAAPDHCRGTGRGPALPGAQRQRHGEGLRPV